MRATASGAWASYRRIWAAHTTSTFGDQVTLVALPLATYLRTESALAVGIVSSMEAITAILLGLVAGAAADRLPYRAVLLTTDLTRAAVLGLVALAVTGETYPVGILFAAAAALGAMRVLHDAAENAVVPLLVQPADLLRANGQMNASEAAANATGPAFAGALIAAGGPALAMAADAATFAASGAVVGRTHRLDNRARGGGGQPERRGRLRAEIVESLRILAGDRPMVKVLVMAMAINIVAVTVEGQFIPYAKEVLGIGGLGIGAYWALGGSVAVLTSLLAGRHQTARGDVIIIGLAVFSLGVLAAGALPSHVTAAAAYIGAGIGNALVVTHVLSLRQQRFPVRLQGRISMAVRTTAFVFVPPAHIAGGALAAAAGPEVLYIAAASVGLAGAGVGVLSGLLRLRSAA